MKTTYIYIGLLALLGGLSTSFLSSCTKDDDVDENNSIFVPTNPATITTFDKWLEKNITYPYNINVLYKYDDINTDYTYYLVPADLEKAQVMIQIVKYSWLEAYDETVGLDFTRKYAPKQITFIGSSAYNIDGTEVIATAEGGLKVTMYRINSMVLTREYMNKYYFHTMHHEFCHILNQTKSYSTDFQRITENAYVAGDWYQVDAADAAKAGFVSPYAMYEPVEDFAEVYSRYLTSTDKEWQALLSMAGTAGSKIINAKLDMVRNYTESVWNFELDALRSNVQRRTDKAMLMEFENL